MATLFRQTMLVIGTSAISIGNGGSAVHELSSSSLQPSAIVLPSGSAASLPSLNDSAPIVPVKNLDDYAFTCSGPTYGFFHDTEISSCVDATRIIASGRDRIRFAERGTPEITSDAYPLPWRWMDQTASCYVQVILRPGATSGSNSLYKLRDAASALITHCALRQGEGGLAFNTGGDGNVGLIVGKYQHDPNAIQCGSPMPFIGGCRDIMAGIPVDRLGLLFGPVKPPAIVKLPAKTQSYDRSCTLRIWTMNHDGDVTSWYKVWEAANAVYFKCISPGYRGTFRGLGNDGQLFVSFLGPSSGDGLDVDQAP